MASRGSRCFSPKTRAPVDAALLGKGFPFMRTNIPEKLLKIVEEIDENGNASLTRLTVLKKWLERPERLSAFAIWVAARAVSAKAKPTVRRRNFSGKRGSCWQVWTKFGQNWTGLRHMRCMTACGIFKTNTKINGGGRCASSTIGTSCWWSMDWPSVSGIWTHQRTDTNSRRIIASITTRVMATA